MHAVSESLPEPQTRRNGWSIARHALLASGLLIAVLQFYLMHIYVEILSLQRVEFFNPAAAVQHSALEVLRRLC
jgi:hypothetical protein